MKQHILAALQEQVDGWEALLSRMDESQILAVDPASGWSIKDTLVHVWAWQQRTIARFEAALSDQEPEFPDWMRGVDPEDYGATDRINDWIFSTYHDQPWPSVFLNWQTRYRRLLELAAQVPEKDLLDSARYSWLQGYPLALILLATYDHHHEHYEELLPWLRQLVGRAEDTGALE